MIRILTLFATATAFQEQAGSEAVDIEAGVDRIRRAPLLAASPRWSAVALAAAIVSGNYHHHSPR